MEALKPKILNLLFILVSSLCFADTWLDESKNGDKTLFVEEFSFKVPSKVTMFCWGNKALDIYKEIQGQRDEDIKALLYQHDYGSTGYLSWTEGNVKALELLLKNKQLLEELHSETFKNLVWINNPQEDKESLSHTFLFKNNEEYMINSFHWFFGVNGVFKIQILCEEIDKYHGGAFSKQLLQGVAKNNTKLSKKE